MSDTKTSMQDRAREVVDAWTQPTKAVELVKALTRTDLEPLAQGLVAFAMYEVEAAMRAERAMWHAHAFSDGRKCIDCNGVPLPNRHPFTVCDECWDRARATTKPPATADESTCTTWDATSGMRCNVDGCAHEAGGDFLCPCHEVQP